MTGDALQRELPQRPRTSVERKPTRQSMAVLGAVVVVLLAIRLPVIARQPGGHDEEFYAFPGLTILEDGVPRLPHVPQRDPSRVFYKSDVAFFAEPPLYFYVQAACYALLPDVYGTARLASLAAGVAAVVLVYLLSRRWYADETIALWAAGLYSLLRMFYFTTLAARPDIQCTVLGLGAVYALDRWRVGGRRVWFVAAGVLIGLGGLTHPFAITYAIPLAVWVAWTERGWRRLAWPLLLAVIAIATCALWLPLIAAYPEEFRAQFGNNILHPAGPGLLDRLLSPWSSFTRQAEVTWERAGPIQFCLLLAAVVAATVLDGRRRDGGQKPVWLAVSAIVLNSIIMGQHPGYGYWSFAAAFFAMCLSSVLLQTFRRVVPPGRRRWLGLPAGALVVAVLLPGLGLRTWWATVTHWNDVDYDAPRFAAQIMEELPADARYVVGIEYVLDFYAGDRSTLIGETDPFYLQSQDFPYDYLIVGRDGLDQGLPEAMQGELLRSYGRRDDLFTCYAEVYMPKRSQ